jgi:hypothetical protein
MVDPNKLESGTVTVACKLPHGMILQMHEMVEGNEPVMGGGTRSFKIARRVGEPVRLRGNAVPFGKAPMYAIEGGYALTPGVDAAFFSAWLKQNADHDAVKNKLIYAVGNKDVGKPRELRELKSGLEPLDMSQTERNGRATVSDLRVPRTNNPNLTELSEATED